MYSCDLLICPRSAECSQVWGEMLNRRNLAEAVKPTPLSLSYSKCGIFARNAWKMRYSSISKTNHWLLWHFRDEAVVVPLQPWRCQWTDGKSSFPAHGTKSVVELGGGWRLIVTIKMIIMMTMTMTIVMMMTMTMVTATMLPIVCQVFCLATSTGLTIDSRDSPKVVALMQASST